MLAHRGLVNSDEATAGVVENSFAAIAAAHAGGMTIYRIAAVLGISQATARHALGLDRAKR